MRASRATLRRFRRISPLWLLPVVAVASARYQPGHMVLAIKALVALGAVLLVARRPQPALLVLVALLPFQEALLAGVYRLGIPAAAVRDLGFWKEAVVAGCLAAALRRPRQRHRAKLLDAVDVLSIAYLGIVGLYFLFPRLFVHPSGPLAIGPPTNLTTLATAVRNDTAFVILLVVVRRLPIDVTFRRRFVAVVLATGAAVAVVGAFEFGFSKAWNHLIVSTIRVPNYLASVLNVTSRNPNDIRVYSHFAGLTVLRIGSVFFDQLSCGLYLVLALAIGLERVVRGNARLAGYLVTALIGVAILLTQTRAAILAAVVVIACTLLPSIERRGPARARYAFLVAAALLAVVPLTIATGLAARISGATHGEVSTTVHINRTAAGARALLAAPLGRGLGTGATNGTRFGVRTTLTSENYYLQVGNETGAVSMVVFLALVVVLNRRLRRLVMGRNDLVASSWRGALLGLSLAALFLQVWLDLALAWTVWIGIGVCLGPPGGQGMGSAVASPSDFRRYLSATARRAPLVVATLAAAVLATDHFLPRNPRYAAHSALVMGLPQFLARPGAPTSSDDLMVQLGRQRQVYAVAATQAPIAAEAALLAHVARTPGTVAAETKVSSPPGTLLLQISVSDSDAAVARALADGVAQALIANAATLQQPNPLAGGAMSSLTASLAAPAAVPSTAEPDGSRTKLAEAAVFALLVATGAIILVEYLDITVRDGDDIERRLELPVLAIVAPTGTGTRWG